MTRYEKEGKGLLFPPFSDCRVIQSRLCFLLLSRHFMTIRGTVFPVLCPRFLSQKLLPPTVGYNYCFGSNKRQKNVLLRRKTTVGKINIHHQKGENRVQSKNKIGPKEVCAGLFPNRNLNCPTNARGEIRKSHRKRTVKECLSHIKKGKIYKMQTKAGGYKSYVQFTSLLTLMYLPLCLK